MRSDTAIKVLGLDELEEADGAGVVLALEERRQATLAARLVEAAEAGGGASARDEGLERRAFRLLKDGRVAACVREATAGAERPIRGAWLVVVIIVLALALGFLTNEVGSGKVINLLSIPLLGLVVWNLLVYALWLVATWGSGRSRSEAAVPGRGGWLNQWLLRGAGVRADAPVGTPVGEGAVAAVSAARRAFWEKWVRVLRAQAAAWVEIAFHAGAIGLATGLVAGMYARGLSSEYKAAWESTFLGAPAVSTVLKTALGPAALVLGKAIPDAGPMQALNIHDQEALDPHLRESAASWIHLYALTAVMFIGLPRLALLGLAVRGLRRVGTHCPVESGLQRIFDTLVRQVTGRENSVLVLPFACEATSERQPALRELLRRLWPETGSIVLQPTVAYGDEDEAIGKLDWTPGTVKKGGTDGVTRLVVLMSLSATPENEVHGELLREVDRRAARDRAPAGDGDGLVAVVLDTQAFRTQFETMPEAERRLRERRAAWERLIDRAMESAFSEDGSFYIWRRVGRKHHS